MAHRRSSHRRPGPTPCGPHVSAASGSGTRVSRHVDVAGPPLYRAVTVTDTLGFRPVPLSSAPTTGGKPKPDGSCCGFFRRRRRSSAPTTTRSERNGERGVDFKWSVPLPLPRFQFASSSINGLQLRRILPIHARHQRLRAPVFLFRILILLDYGLAAGMGLDLGWQQSIVVLSVLVLLYPFLWVWTVIGTLWFNSARICLPEEGQKWGFLIWLPFSYCGLACMACVAVGKWLNRRHALQLRAQQGIPISEYGVLVDMIRVPSRPLPNNGPGLG